MNSSDYIADVASMKINVSPLDAERYIAILEAKVSKLTNAALPGQIREPRGAVDHTATPPSQMAKTGKVLPASLAVKRISHLGKLVEQELRLFSDVLQERLWARTRFEDGLPAFPTTCPHEAHLITAKTTAAVSRSGARRRIVPSSRSKSASREIHPPPKLALNMPDFPTEGHSTPCMGQAAPAIGRHLVGPGEPPQGPSSPGPG